MKKRYFTPRLEVSQLKKTDIVCASPTVIVIEQETERVGDLPLVSVGDLTSTPES